MHIFQSLIMEQVLIIFITSLNMCCNSQSVSGNYLLVSPNDVEVFDGTNATFKCVANKPVVNWTWYLTRDGSDGPVIINSNNLSAFKKYVVVVDEQKTTSWLTIVNVSINDQHTEYNCQLDAISSDFVTLSIIIGLESSYPKCNILNQTMNLHVGDKIQLVCRAEGGVPRPSLQWFMDHAELSSTEFTSYPNEKYYFEILILHLKQEDNGKECICKAEGKTVTGNNSCSIIPLSIPPVAQITEIYEPSYGIGDPLGLICSAEGIPYISNYSWVFDDELLLPSDVTIRVTRSWASLSIHSLGSHHSGINVRCNANIPSGLIGSDVFTIILFLDDSKDDNFSQAILLACVISGAMAICVIVGMFAQLKLCRRPTEIAPCDNPTVNGRSEEREGRSDKDTMQNKNTFMENIYATPSNPIASHSDNHTYESAIGSSRDIMASSILAGDVSCTSDAGYLEPHVEEVVDCVK